MSEIQGGAHYFASETLAERLKADAHPLHRLDGRLLTALWMPFEKFVNDELDAGTKPVDLLRLFVQGAAGAAAGLFGAVSDPGDFPALARTCVSTFAAELELAAKADLAGSIREAPTDG